MWIKTAALGAISCVVAYPTIAGDAVAIGYDYDGAWTAVTYNRSSTPKGGAHYHDASAACQFAVRDLWARASEYLVRTEIIGQSDRTGYVAIAQGKAIERNKDVTAVGRGRSQDEADANALNLLNSRQAKTETAIVYRYFSYGSDSRVGGSQLYGGRCRAKRVQLGKPGTELGNRGACSRATRSSRKVAASQTPKRRT